MKTIIISYSLTGNNADLAKNVAQKLTAEHISITESKPRSMGTIIFDMLLNRAPKIQMPVTKAEEYDLVIFVGPVWIGQVATPFRACFKQLGPKIDKYVFVSISGGADGPNPKLADELKKRLGKEPVAVIDLHIADLLPKEPKPTRKDTSSYRINGRDIKNLTGTIEAALKKTTANPD
jgi:flavodoxin